jgi:siderophore synthetase component
VTAADPEDVGRAHRAVAPGHPGSDGHDQAERLLASRIINTLLRENYGDLMARVTRDGDSPVLNLPIGPGGGPASWAARQESSVAPALPAGARDSWSLPLEPDGFLADVRLRGTAAGDPAVPLTLDDVDALIAAIGDPRDRAGAAAFAEECRQALTAIRLKQRHVPASRDRLAQAWRAAPDTRSGPRGQLGYEVLAATQQHPAYPTSEARLGLSDEDSLRYAPEHNPEFPLRWLAVPSSRLTVAGHAAPLPPGWPTMPEVGLPEALAATHHLLPVHPITARDKVVEALAETGLARRQGATRPAVLAPGSALRVIPTLSVRTVAVASDPGTHVKLPLPTSTLGMLNRRFIKPGTFVDGALVQGILARARRDDPLLRGLLLTDESSYAHAGHHWLGYLLRRLPSGLDQHRIVSIAALLAPDVNLALADATPDLVGRPLVIEELADWAWDGDLIGLFTAYLRQLFTIQVRLFAKYGIALESHQQNAALVLDGPTNALQHAPRHSQHAPHDQETVQGDRLRLLVKDFDGALLHFPRLRLALGTDIPAESAFADPRLLTTSDDALADVFITITVHLCAGALAFGLADRGVASLPDLLALVRRELNAALDTHAAWPAAALLRARVLDAERLTGKSMVTAGTLVAKSRTGASDINKFYGTNGPNYLKDVPRRNCR